MGFSQTIKGVDTNGNVTAMITINSLKIDIMNENKTKLSFDSQGKKDKNAPTAQILDRSYVIQTTPMTQLLGRSYIIQTTPTGEVKPLDTQAAMESVQWAYDKEVVQSILGHQVISERHQITALPKDKLHELSVNKTWSNILPSPLPLLSPKSYQKTYTLMAIKDNVATFEMTGTESAEPAESSIQTEASKQMFEKEYDCKDDYRGMIEIDLVSRQVIQFEETLVGSYLAKEISEEAESEKENNPLSITFTFRKKIEPISRSKV